MPHRCLLRLTRASLVLCLVGGIGGCAAVNGLYFGLEEDVDHLVLHLDAAGDALLPHGPRPPREARRADRERVRFQPDPDAGAWPPRASHESARHPHARRRPVPAEASAAPSEPEAPPRPEAAWPGDAPPAATPTSPPRRRTFDPPRHHELVFQK